MLPECIKLNEPPGMIDVRIVVFFLGDENSE